MWICECLKAYTVKSRGYYKAMNTVCDIELYEILMILLI